LSISTKANGDDSEASFAFTMAAGAEGKPEPECGKAEQQGTAEGGPPPQRSNKLNLYEQKKVLIQRLPAKKP
jgi:hypothetical protein